MPCSARCPRATMSCPTSTPVLADATDAVATLKSQQRGRPTKQLMQAEQRLQDLQDAQQKLVRLPRPQSGLADVLLCDAAHRPVALRLRQPYSGKFVSFKPGIAGVFGRELFTPYANPQRKRSMIS